MKKIVVLCLLLINLCACKDDETAPFEIESIETLDDIIVGYKTAFEDIIFPSQVQVTYSSGQTELINVTFSQGLYSGDAQGSIVTLTGSLALSKNIINPNSLEPSINVIVSFPSYKLKSVSYDGSLFIEYFYDNINRLSRYKFILSNIEYTYSYQSLTNHKIVERKRKIPSGTYPEKYFYHTNGNLDKVEFYGENNNLGETRTYTYSNGLVSRWDNSNLAVTPFRSFEYNPQSNVSRISFSTGNPWTYTYVADKSVLRPLVLDQSDPLNQVSRPVASFSYVNASSYTSIYEYNMLGYPTKETRVYFDHQQVVTYVYEQ